MEKINMAGFLAGLGRTSLQAGVLGLVVLAAQYLLRKQLTPRWRCSLWLLVVVRLLLPVSFESTVSMFNLLPRWNLRTENSFAPIVQLPVTQSLSETAKTGDASPAVANSISADQQPLELPRIPHNPSLATPPSSLNPPISAPGQKPFHQPTVAEVLFWAWFGGAISFLGYIILSSLMLARTLAGLQIVSNTRVLAVLADCRARLNVRMSLELVESSALRCPALYGLVRPRLVLPLGFTENM